MTHQTIVVPDIGGAEGAEVVELLVAVGDAIELEQSLIVLESDKASMEIPASHAGVITELKIAVGDELSEGDAILILELADADISSVDEVDVAASASASGERAPATEAVAVDEAMVDLILLYMVCISLNLPLSKSLPKSPKTGPENKATPSVSSSNSSKSICGSESSSFSK